MQYSDTSTLSGIVQDIDFRCSTAAVAYPTADKTRNVNKAYDRAIEFMTRNSKKIKYAETSLTPPYNLTLYNTVSGTNAISITIPFKFERAEVKDADGKWHELKLIDATDIEGPVQTEQAKTGTPTHIRIEGNRAILIPTPNASVTGGLAIFGSPEPALFASTDTTKVPLLPRFAHALLSVGASLDYCNIYKQDRVPALAREEQDLYAQLQDYLESRDLTNIRIAPMKQDNR